MDARAQIDGSALGGGAVEGLAINHDGIGRHRFREDGR
jgi:hypothetical protein